MLEFGLGILIGLALGVVIGAVVLGYTLIHVYEAEDARTKREGET